jgi:DNA repair protein RadC
MVALGTANSVEVHPRDVFRLAIKRNAVAVIVAHNHPSGDPEPSSDDRALTERLTAAGRVLGIPLLDHLVLCKSAHVSLADRGWM